MIRALLIALVTAFPAAAEQIVMGLSQSEVEITATFDGSDILVFGAVKRDSAIPTNPPLEVIITAEGPGTALDIRQMSRRLGIWVNTSSVHITRAPSFYAVASTGPLDKILSETDDLRHGITINRALRTIGTSDDADDVEPYTDALVRIQTRAGLYQRLEGSVELQQDTLFDTTLDLPANLVEGKYRLRVFLLRGGTVIDDYETVLQVHKIGFERWVYLMSQQQPLIYGLGAILLAVVSGWLASVAFRSFQR